LKSIINLEITLFYSIFTLYFIETVVVLLTVPYFNTQHSPILLLYIPSCPQDIMTFSKPHFSSYIPNMELPSKRDNNQWAWNKNNGQLSRLQTGDSTILAILGMYKQTSGCSFPQLGSVWTYDVKSFYIFFESIWHHSCYYISKSINKSC